MLDFGSYTGEKTDRRRKHCYEKNCYQELNEQGGWLFSIGVYKDDSYTEMPSYEVIKKKGSKTYVAMYPTDVQFDGASQKAQTNYCKMTQQKFSHKM